MVNRMKKPLKKSTRETIGFYLFISPFLVGLLLFTLIPMISSLYYSFNKMSILNIANNSQKWVGVTNYVKLFTADTLFVKSIGNTFLYAIVGTLLGIIPALLVSVWLNRKFVANKFVRVLVYLPALIPGVAGALVWLQLFSNDCSLFNTILGLFHIPPIEYLSYDNALWSIMFMNTVTTLGPNMILFIAALQGVPKELLEAAELEGAGPVRRLLTITIPFISPTLFYQLVVGFIGGLQIYTQIVLLTGFGTESTISMAMSVVTNAFNTTGNKTMGYACAQAWVMFVIILLFTGLFFKVINRKVYYGGD